MGGGTESEPHVTVEAREMNILTVGVTTLPLRMKDQREWEVFTAGLEELKDISILL